MAQVVDADYDIAPVPSERPRRLHGLPSWARLAACIGIALFGLTTFVLGTGLALSNVFDRGLIEKLQANSDCKSNVTGNESAALDDVVVGLAKKDQALVDASVQALIVARADRLEIVRLCSSTAAGK
jgi:hypothetical protein